MTDGPFAAGLALIPGGSAVLCAVSGGADSMCLLHLLHSRRDELGIRVCAAHFEHGIRGGESLRDCRLAEEYCAANGIELAVEHCDIPAEAALRGLGIEETARLLRYGFLKRAAEKLGCTLIATAHNADDNAETMLLNLARGTGGAGLCGIPPVNGNVIRPLLSVSRAEIEQYVKENAVPFVTDSSNLTDEYSRNRLRHHVMPVMTALNPAFVRSAANTAGLLRRDEEFFLELADEFIAANSDGQSLPMDKLAALRPSVASRVVRRLCPRGQSNEQTERVLKLCARGTDFKADLHGIRVCGEGGRIYFGVTARPEPPGMTVLEEGVELELPAAGLSIICEKTDYSADVNNSFKTYQLNCANIYGTLYIGPRLPGDKMRPAGRKCTKTLKQLFLERRLTPAQKAQTLVIRDDRGVLLIPSMAIDERAVSRPGDRVFKITIKNI